jgi:dTDP-4-amino-4,6-dideoxygalactose transaminase
VRKLLHVPQNPGLDPRFLVGRPVSPASVLRYAARGRAVWDVCYARIAIRKAVELLKLRRGAKVLMPAFTCDTVSEPCRATGADVSLIRVGRDTRVDWDHADRLAADPKARALIVVHFLGFPEDLAAASEVCRRHGLTMIEDCSHGLFSLDGRKPLGTTAPLAVHGFRKSVPVVHGAALAIDRRRFAPPSAAPEGPEEGGQRHLVWLETVVRRMRSHFMATDHLPLLEMDLRGRAHVREREAYGDESPPHRIDRASRIILGHQNRAAIVRKRRANYRRLAAALGDWAVFARLPAGVCPLGFPVLVRDGNRRVARRLAEVGILFHWQTALLPAKGDSEPNALWLGRHIFTLPCHQDLGPEHVEQMIRRFRKVAGPPARR